MDHPTQRQPRAERRGPEIYVHLEFRVSWGGKKQQTQPPKNHQITFRSRGPRERTPAFPRQVPAPNTNYLAAIHTFEHRQSALREARRSHAHANHHPHRHHQMQEYYHQNGPQQHPPSHLQIPTIREPERPSRADARQPSHERGSSAPPPIGDNPWDVTALPQDDHHHHYHHPARITSDQTTPTRSLTEIKRKPLPAPPSQFRLGEGGQPWSTWSLPDGYEPDDSPADTNQHGTHNSFYSDLLPVSPQATTVGGVGDRNSTTYATNPTMVSTFSPEPSTSTSTGGVAGGAAGGSGSGSGANPRDLETGRARELGNLSAAMMTVDNGFETQWWYQGTRKSVAVDDLPPPPGILDHAGAGEEVDESPVVHHHHYQHPHPHPHPHQQQQQQQQRWSASDAGVLSEPPSPVMTTATPRRGMTGVVSPMTEAAFSPAGPVPVGLVVGVQRSLSTRSEELWFTERG